MGKIIYNDFGLAKKAAWGTTLSTVEGAYKRLGFHVGGAQADLGGWDFSSYGGLEYGKPVLSSVGASLAPPEFDVTFGMSHGLPLYLWFGTESYADSVHTLTLGTAGFSTPVIADTVLKSDLKTYFVQGCFVPRLRLMLTPENRFLLGTATLVGQGALADLTHANYALADVASAPTSVYQYGSSSSSVLTFGGTSLATYLRAVDLSLSKEITEFRKIDSEIVSQFSVTNPLAVCSVVLDTSDADNDFVDDLVDKTAADLVLKVARSATDYVSVTITGALISQIKMGLGRGDDALTVLTFVGSDVASATRDGVGAYATAFSPT